MTTVVVHDSWIDESKSTTATNTSKTTIWYTVLWQRTQCVAQHNQGALRVGL